MALRSARHRDSIAAAGLAVGSGILPPQRPTSDHALIEILNPQIRTWFREAGNALYISLFDRNNSNARPLELMSNPVGSGRNWENQVGSGVVFDVVNEVLKAFAEKKNEWRAANYKFTPEEAVEFLVKRMQEVSLFLR